MSGSRNQYLLQDCVRQNLCFINCRMIVFDYRSPSPELRSYVSQYRIIGFEFSNVLTLPAKPYWPRPENCLVFYPRDTELITHPTGEQQERGFRSALIGQPLIVTNRQVGRDFVVFQVVFQPGALFRLTGLPVNQLTDTFIDAEAVFSSSIQRVNERLSSLNSHLEMIAVVEDFLRSLVRKVRYDIQPMDKAAGYLLQQARIPSLDWLASEACLSRKQFYRRFIERMGVSPKFFARIVHFDRAVKLKNARPQTDWLSIALELGYYDYQHLVRDFKEFTHLTPTAFYQLDSQAPERVFGHIEI